MDNQPSSGNRNQSGIYRCWHALSTTPVKVVAALLCLVLLCFSISLVILPTSAAQASNLSSQDTPTPTSPVGGTPSPTITITPDPTATSTPDPTPSPSPSPSPTATFTPTPKPTRTPKPSPTPSPTATATTPPTATATAPSQTTPLPQPTATHNPGATSTPTPVPATQSTGNGGGTGSPPSNPTPPTTSGGSGGRSGTFLLPVLIGLVATLAIAAVCVLGFVFLRRRILPADPLFTNLPPSGARPWSRFRQGSMHGSTNIYTQQTSADAGTGAALPFTAARNFSSAPPFSAAAASWAIQMNGSEDNMNAPQSQWPQAVPPGSPFASNPFSTQGVPPVPPVQQQPFAPNNPPPGPAWPQSQPYPSWQPNNNYPTQGPQVPQQAFPPQQNFPPAPPNAGFYPSNSVGGDIALAIEALHRASSDTGNVGNSAHHKPTPIRLRGISTSQTDNIPQLSGTQTNPQNTQDIPGLPTITETPRPRPEAHSEQLPRLDAPFFRDALTRLHQQDNNELDEPPSDHPNWL